MIRTLLPIRSLTSRMAKASLSSAAALPSNLMLANEKVFEAVPVPVMNEENYYFPILNVPETIIVHKFTEPGQFAEPSALVKKIFEVPIRKDILLDVVRYIRNKRRQPHKTKRMSEIAGSNKKPYPQKGQGYSQVGHRRNSSWRGGMKAHGPRLRDFSIDINRKVRALGQMMAFASKYREGNLLVVDNFNLPTHKTKDLNNLLKGHGCAESRCLFVDLELPDNFVKASANLDLSVSVKRQHMNVYDILKKDKLVITQAAFETSQRLIMSQYNYSGRMKYFQTTKKILDFCEKAAETNGWVEKETYNFLN